MIVKKTLRLRAEKKKRKLTWEEPERRILEHWWCQHWTEKAKHHSIIDDDNLVSFESLLRLSYGKHYCLQTLESWLCFERVLERECVRVSVCKWLCVCVCVVDTEYWIYKFVLTWCSTSSHSTFEHLDGRFLWAHALTAGTPFGIVQYKIQTKLIKEVAKPSVNILVAFFSSILSGFLDVFNSHCLNRILHSRNARLVHAPLDANRITEFIIKNTIEEKFAKRFQCIERERKIVFVHSDVLCCFR